VRTLLLNYAYVIATMNDASGMVADIVAFDMHQLTYAGAQHDPVAAMLFAALQQVNWSIINGKMVVRESHLETVDLPSLTKRHNSLARQLVNG
jgi:8-oxoguanine deaminase